MAEDREQNQTETKQTARPAYGINSEGELLQQIASADIQKDLAKKKKKKVVHKSLSSFSIVFVMRTTLFIDSLKRNHKDFFRICSYLWAFFLSLIYAGGITMISTIHYSKIHFPTIVSNHLKRNEISVESLRVVDNSLSHIQIAGLEDAEKTYRVSYVNLYSTFGDFLRKKVERVELENVVVKIKESQNSVNLSPLLSLILNLSERSRINIQTVVIKSGVLEFEGENYKIPINFSMDATLQNNNRMDIPLRIKDENTNLMAHLTISKNGEDFIWSIKNLRGSTDILSKKPENVSGSITLKTKELSPTELNIETNFSLGSSKKTLFIDLKKNGRLFEGVTTYTKSHTQDDKTQIDADISFNFKGLEITSFSSFATKKPFSIDIETLTHPSFELNSLKTTINGDLNCQKRICQINVAQPSSIRIKEISYKDGVNSYSNTSPLLFTLLPQQNTMKIANSFLNMNIKGENLEFKGKKSITNTPIELTSKEFIIATDISKPDQPASFSGRNLNFKNKSHEIKNAAVYVKDIYNTANQFSLSTDYIKLFENNVIKQPFALDIQSENGDTKAKAIFADGQIETIFNGTINLNSGHFSGTIYMPPVNLAHIKNISEVSDLFPDRLTDLTGKISLYGNIDWKNERQISGPMYLSLKNINFSKGETKIKNLNTVLTLQSLAPFISQATQNLAIDEIEAAIPLQNVRASVKFENQLLRIFSLTGSFAGIPLTADHTTIPYKSYSSLLYFRNGSFDWKDINPYLNVPDLTLEGTGSIYIPIEATPTNTKINNAEARLINTTLLYNGSNEELKKNFFTKGNEYSVRSGTIVLNSKEKNVLDAYINFEGREKNETERSFYRADKTFNFQELFKPEATTPLPSNILKMQKQLFGN